MIKKQSKNTLAEKIAGVLSAVPSQFDPDDDNIDDTSAKIAGSGDFEEDNEEEEALLSKFRRQNVDLLADVDQRYAGKKGSRKSLKDESSEESDEELSDFNDDHSETGSDQSGNEEEPSEEEKEISGSGSDSEGGSIALSENDEDTNFQHLSETNASQQVKKGLCVRNQMNIWENLLEMRIQLQKSLVAANKMPQTDDFKGMQKSDEAEQFREKVQETQENLGKVVDKLIQLQQMVVKKFPESKNVLKNNGGNQKEKVNQDSDEEIPSDTEDEQDESNDESEEESKLQKGKKRRLNDYEKDISELHEKYRKYRNDTIEKWNTKTRLSVTKNAGPTHSVISQIEHILSDKEKLRKRTQLKRTEYRILGKPEAEANVLESNEDNGDVKPVEEYNSEIFDDSDFYHQLLRELIEVKSADVTDPVQLSKQWIQLQNLRSKMKRKIDTRTTKGRKIRYAVHTKLVNFMAPCDNGSWTEEAKNDLYSSLFGKIQPKTV
ncbi:protein AATF-like [Anthonomus grandis grandis]|uniref:protein AATF-like n=1 Tax=Anthonomus grandis grandis TaxID=2921223 RepID=UPI00216612C8|nr:protein AATF-like [Anthonomus grandis grandis]